MGILRETFSTSDTAMMKIEEGITDFYKTDYSEYYAKNKDIIDTSIASVQQHSARILFR